MEDDLKEYEDGDGVQNDHIDKGLVRNIDI
jgi:hypothetical protein